MTVVISSGRRSGAGVYSTSTTAVHTNKHIKHAMQSVIYFSFFVVQ